jgi:uncharacterized protein (DUF952 family)
MHLTTASAWAEAQVRGSYAADSLATEGFIHCSDPHQVLWVANTRFHGRRDLMLLQADASRLAAPVRYENLEGGDALFPHVYGALDLDAIVAADPFPCRPNGMFDHDQLAAVYEEEGLAMTSDTFTLHQMSHAIAGAIARREIGILAGQLAPGFTYRGSGGASVSDAAAFLEGIRTIPGEIIFVRIESVAVDVSGTAAMATGVQHAQLQLDGQIIDDRRSFADFFVKVDGAWKLRAAADFPPPASE